MVGLAGADVGLISREMSGLLGLLPGARIDPLALSSFALALVLIVLARDVRPRAGRWLFRVVAGAMIAVGFLTGVWA